MKVIIIILLILDTDYPSYNYLNTVDCKILVLCILQPSDYANSIRVCDELRQYDVAR